MSRVKRQINQTALRRAIVESFTMEELDILCADIEQSLADQDVYLEVSLDTVGGTSLEGKVAKLIEFLDKRRHLNHLVEAVRRARPALDTGGYKEDLEKEREEAEEARLAALAREAAERRLAEQEQILAEQKRQLEAQLQELQRREAELARQAEERHRAELERQEEGQRKSELARQQELAWQAKWARQEAEQRQIAERQEAERRQAAQLLEQQRLAAQQRPHEQQRPIEAIQQLPQPIQRKPGMSASKVVIWVVLGIVFLCACYALIVLVTQQQPVS